MSECRFVHLQVHSEYSLLDGIVRIQPLVARALALGMPAVAVTDLANLYGAVKFYKEAIAAGVKPVIGADCWIHPAAANVAPGRLVLLCQDLDGYRHLCRLLSRAYHEGQQAGRPCIQPEWLVEANAGLIAVAPGQDSEPGQAIAAGNEARAAEIARHYAALFDDRFYLGVQRTGQPGQAACTEGLLDLAEQAGLPAVATNAVQFLDPADFEAHEIRVCIQEGRTLGDTRRPRRFSEEQFFRDHAAMEALFPDAGAALDNSLEIARRCNLQLEIGRPFLPAYPVAEDERVDDVLGREGEQGLAQRLAAHAPAAPREDYDARLALELDVIREMGFAGYFLIVADFIGWARRNGIPVGPGRGSGAGSLVAWSLGITELDPIAHGLLFERFLNPERVSLPDFDVDFCMEGRDRVIEYVTERYGRDRVAQIMTHGTMAARLVVRDVGRVLDQPYGFVDKLAKLIPFEIGMTLDKALAQEELLRARYESEPEVTELLDMARSLEGLVRGVGKHAGGVVIAPDSLDRFTPLYFEQGGNQPVTQFDMKDLEDVGLVKFDFLGLRTLTIIDWAVAAINRSRAATGEAPLDLAQLPLDDPQTYALLRSSRTGALFQLESRGMRELIQRLQPTCFDDVVGLLALFRPGPLQSGMVEDFVNRKHGRAVIEYPHPALEPVLRPTYGVILYQEQVMQIAQVLAGYSLGAADLLRRAMGKKKPEEMAKQRDIFVDGARSQGVPERQASYIFDLMEKFAGYGFNKSHSVAYAVIAYQTAWLKAHYPAVFMAATLSADMEHTDKIVGLIAECRDLGIEVSPPDVNKCGYAFEATPGGEILYGLGAVKGVGRSAVEALLEARPDQPFADLFDVCARVDLKRLNRRALEALVKAGAFDAIGNHRASQLATLPAAIAIAEQRDRNRLAGQVDLFGAEVAAPDVAVPAEVQEWTEAQRLEAEKEALGLFLTGHPIERYEQELGQIVDCSLSELKPTANRSVVVAGMVVGLRVMNTRRGDRMAFITLDDRTGRLEIGVFAELFARRREVLGKDRVLIVEGQVNVDEVSGGFRMSAESIHDVEEARERYARLLEIDLDDEAAANGTLEHLAQVLRGHLGGNCGVRVNYRRDGAVARLQFGEDWKVHPTERLIEAVESVVGTRRAHLACTRAAAAPRSTPAPGI